MNVLFRRNPAFIYDVCNVYIAKSNPRYSWINPYIRDKGEDDDRKYVETLYDKFKDIDLKTSLIGRKKNGSPALISSMFMGCLKEYSDSISFSLFLDYITNIELLKKRISNLYFGVDYIDDASFIHNIHSSAIDNSIRAELYDLVLYSEQYINELKKNLEEIRFVMQNIYSDPANTQMLLNANEAFNMEEFSKSKQVQKKFFTSLKYKTCYVSFSIFSQYLVLREMDNNENGWLILGVSYSKLLEEQDDFISHLHSFGDAIGDPLRVKILCLVLEHGELTLADISKKLGVVNTIAIYHMDIMKKCNLLRHRYEGRKVLYWINKSQFNMACDEIKKLFGGIEG